MSLGHTTWKSIKTKLETRVRFFVLFCLINFFVWQVVADSLQTSPVLLRFRHDRKTGTPSFIEWCVSLPNCDNAQNYLKLCQYWPVLVPTSTLALGVNLPAHLVVVKGTHQLEGGKNREYDESQVLQMIGRAGRPQVRVKLVFHWNHLSLPHPRMLWWASI